MIFHWSVMIYYDIPHRIKEKVVETIYIWVPLNLVDIFESHKALWILEANETNIFLLDQIYHLKQVITKIVKENMNMVRK